VPIETPEQRNLDSIKSYVNKGESLVPKDKTYAQYRNQYYYALRKYGITRETGATAHGLRHEHLNELYQKETGHETPVEGGRLHQTDPLLDSHGRKLVAERAGTVVNPFHQPISVENLKHLTLIVNNIFSQKIKTLLGCGPVGNM
jgi:hypothetical protein